MPFIDHQKEKTTLKLIRKVRQIDPIHKWRLFYFCSVIVQFAQGQKNN